MKKMTKISDNCKVVYGALVEMGNEGFARDVVEFLATKNITKTFNSVNATLAALVGTGVITKVAKVREKENKMLTFYTVADALENAIETKETAE